MEVLSAMSSPALLADTSPKVIPTMNNSDDSLPLFAPFHSVDYGSPISNGGEFGFGSLKFDRERENIKEWYATRPSNMLRVQNNQ